MFFGTLLYFVIEITYGYKLNSVALIADSYLMFSNVVALAVACLSVAMSKKKSLRNTYGWARVEILGVLINTVFLTGLCFLMVIHGLKRTFEPSPVKEPKIVLLIGVIGFTINIIGLILFRDSSTKHCDCFTSRLSVLVNVVSISRHSIANHSERTASEDNILANASSTFVKRTSLDKLSKTNLKRTSAIQRLDHLDEDACRDEVQLSNIQIDDGKDEHQVTLGENKSTVQFIAQTTAENDNSTIGHNNDMSVKSILKKNELTRRSNKSVDSTSDKEDQNINARKGIIHLPNETKPHNFWYNCKFTSHLHTSKVIFHIVADGLGATMVVLSSLCIIHFKDNEFLQMYTDPVACIVLSLLTLYIVNPLLKTSALILIQSTPQHIDVADLKRKLLLKYRDDIVSIHEFHVWQLESNRIIATLHIKFHDKQKYIELYKKIQCYFHELGVHSVTIQPEFLDLKSAVNNRQSHCEILCPQNGQLCQKSTCCGAHALFRETTVPEETMC